VTARRFSPVAALTLGVLAGCGGATPETRAPAPADAAPTRRVIEDTAADDDSDVEIVGARGRMEVADIEAGFRPHAAQLEACYTEKVGRRRWLGGQVTLKWWIQKDGTVTQVQIAESDLGAWPVEKCLLDLARQMNFAAPKGGDADFSLPLEFSAKGRPITLGEEETTAQVTPRLADLVECRRGDGGAALAVPDDLVVTAYVGTRGKVQSVGFAAAGEVAVPDAWAECAARKIQGWTLRDPRGMVVKLTFAPGGS
jgi:TonB family protein